MAEPCEVESRARRHSRLAGGCRDHPDCWLHGGRRPSRTVAAMRPLVFETSLATTARSSTKSGRGGSRTPKTFRFVRFQGGCHRQLACSSKSGRRSTRNSHLAVRAAFQAGPQSYQVHLPFVGQAGFGPALSSTPRTRFTRLSYCPKCPRISPGATAPWNYAYVGR